MDQSANKTIMTLIETKETFSEFKRILAEEDIDFTKPGVGLIFSIPVNNVIKSKEE